MKKESNRQSKNHHFKINKKTVGGGNVKWLGVLATYVTVGILGSSDQIHAQDANRDDDIIELSPFVITEDDNIGYLATSTLAGTRLKTNLRDIGSAISVITDELLDDLSATDASTVLSYVMNVDTAAGDQANSALINNTLQSALGFHNATNPVDAQRIRGLGPAAATRGFFLTDIPFDSYNISRITVSRGANSLLFGIGRPGGIIDSSVDRALVESNFGEIRLRVSERGSHRESININRVIKKDRLAIRVAALNERTNHQQEPAYTNKEFIYGAITVVPFKNEKSSFLDRTVIRANVERGTIDSTPVNILPPTDFVSPFFESPSEYLYNDYMKEQGFSNYRSYLEALHGVGAGESFPGSRFIDAGGFERKATINFLTNFRPVGFTAGISGPFTGLVSNDPTKSVPSVGLGSTGLQGMVGVSYWMRLPAADPNRIPRANVWRTTNNFISRVHTPGDFLYPLFQTGMLSIMKTC